MVDNLELILPFLTFDDPNDFYYLQILQRKKENPQLGSNSRVIKNYYINSADYLLKKWDEIKQLCIQFNARASIRLNRRNYEKVAYKAMVNIANSMCNRESQFIKNSYDRAVGQGHSEPKGSKTWILDWDGEFDYTDRINVMTFIDQCEPLITGDKIKEYIPSKSGFHIITQPFDARQFRIAYPEVEVHKDNPTNLFIP
jgi:hypothetical protein